MALLRQSFGFGVADECFFTAPGASFSGIHPH
jgi:hypothetical protein